MRRSRPLPWPLPRLLGPLGARLALAFVAVALAAVAVLGGLTLVASRSEVTDLVDRRQDQDAVEIAATLAQAYEDAGGWDGADLSGAFALTASARGELVVLGPDGQLVARGNESMGELMGRMHGEGAGGTGGTGGTGDMMSAAELGDPRRVAVAVDGSTVGTAVLRFPASGLPVPEREVRDALARTVVAGAGIAGIAALVVAVFVSRRVTRPVVALTDAARRLEAGDREARAGAGVAGVAGATAAPGELGELAAAFDQMADSLRHQDEMRRTLVADVAHELRTPATILRAACEELVDGLAEPTPDRLSSLHDEVLRLGRVIEDLEALASAQAAGLHLDRRRVDLADVAARAADLLRPRFADAGLTLSTTTTPITVDGDADRLHQITTNLLTNALKFTPRGGTVTLTVERLGELAELQVADTGPGIPTDDLPHVFERFWRGRDAQDRSGSGIGLAIVAELTKAHGGRVTAVSLPGQGTTFTVLIPCR
jgi:signal transduction histidine kinase